MNALQSFIASLPGGFLTHDNAHRLNQLDRLHPVLVRCGRVRFTCAVQYLNDMLDMVSASGDYVRDVSLPAGSMERAVDWQSLCPSQQLPAGKVISRTVFPGWMHKHASIGHAYDDTITETNIGL